MVNKNSLDKTLFVLFFFKKMQREISNMIQFGETLNPLSDVSVSSIDHMSNLKDVFGKVDKLGDLWDGGQSEV